MNRDDIVSTEPSGVLEQRVEELNRAVRENRVAIDALRVEFGIGRKEPRLRILIDIMQAELESHRLAIEKLTAESARLTEQLNTLTRTTR